MQNKNITILKDLYKPNEPEQFELEEVLNCIQQPNEINGQLTEYQKLFAKYGKDNERTVAAKNNLPCINFSGTFHGNVVNDDFAQSSGIFLVDIDNVDPASTKDKLAKLPYTVFAFTSPSGNGVKAGIRIDPTLITNDQDFKRMYQCIEPWLATLDITIDPACKDVRRLCFISHDPDMYINYEAEPIDYNALHATPIQEPPLAVKSIINAHTSTLMPATSHSKAYCDKVINDELDTLKSTPEGDRNNQFNKTCFSLFSLADQANHIDHNNLHVQLVEAGLGIGLNENEINATIKSAYAAREKSSRCQQNNESFNRKPTEKQTNKSDQLSRFSLNGKAKEMKEKMLNDVFVLGNVALLGQITVIYASHGIGKTLLVLKMLIDSITAGKIKGEDAYYLNCDDNQRGLITKLELAEKYGFHMLADNHQGFKSSMMSETLQSVIDSDNAHGKIIILDTLKKFTDLMNKKDSSEFMKILRSFVSHGGTAIVLAHVNKHRQDNGKLSYAGTTDVADDSDCFYVIDVVDDGKESGTKTVMFENRKNRGDVVDSVSYSFMASSEVDYLDKLNSVTVIGEEELAQQKLYKDRMAGLAIFEEVYPVIRSIIASGVHIKGEIIKRAMTETGESRRNIEQCLEYGTGKPSNYWQKRQGDKNAQLYHLHTDYRTTGS